MTASPPTTLELKAQIATLQHSRARHVDVLVEQLVALDAIAQRIDVLLERLADAGR